MTEPQPDTVLDCRTSKCPLNFVQTRLALEKIPINHILEVWISQESQSVMNIPKSIQAEGHAVIKQEPLDDTALRLWVQRLK